ncbi:hypothetical protein Dip510_001092 [Elusimicrobium posterum]|uniref:hypothetical protein n=1 Tax=Elusimicrobium posterum TaxID=3116653 RepID=UPI003C76F3DE
MADIKTYLGFLGKALKKYALPFAVMLLALVFLDRFCGSYVKKLYKFYDKEYFNALYNTVYYAKTILFYVITVLCEMWLFIRINRYLSGDENKGKIKLSAILAAFALVAVIYGITQGYNKITGYFPAYRWHFHLALYICDAFASILLAFVIQSLCFTELNPLKAVAHGWNMIFKNVKLSIIAVVTFFFIAYVLRYGRNVLIDLSPAKYYNYIYILRSFLYYFFSLFIFGTLYFTVSSQESSAPGKS